MILRPIEQMPEELKDGRGLLLYGRHEHENPDTRPNRWRKGDHWWAIALWDVWRPHPAHDTRPRWVFALDGRPLDWGAPTHYCELELPVYGEIERQLLDYHRACDALLAALASKDREFFPSKSAVWPTIVSGAELMRKLGIKL